MSGNFWDPNDPTDPRNRPRRPTINFSDPISFTHLDQGTNKPIVPYRKRFATRVEWIPEYVKQYRIDDLGKVVRQDNTTYRGADVGDKEVSRTDVIGAPAVVLKKVPVFVAVLVLRTYVRWEHRYEIPRHKDNDLNNAAVDNLEWVDYRQANDEHRHGYAEMIGEHCDVLNFTYHPHMGKRFKDGVLVTEETVDEGSVVRTQTRSQSWDIETDVEVIRDTGRRRHRYDDEPLAVGFGSSVKKSEPELDRQFGYQSPRLPYNPEPKAPTITLIERVDDTTATGNVFDNDPGEDQ